MANSSGKVDVETTQRLTDLLERLGAISLYLLTDMDHHSSRGGLVWALSA
jgi:hypothetical protein